MIYKLAFLFFHLSPFYLRKEKSAILPFEIQTLIMPFFLFSFCCERLNRSHRSPLRCPIFRNEHNDGSLNERLAPLAPRSRLFFLTFGSPINRPHSERRAPVFCGRVKPGKCRRDLLFERLLMSLPFCSLIAHHQGRCPSDLRSTTRRCAKRPKTSRKDMDQEFVSTGSDRETFSLMEKKKQSKHLQDELY